MVKTHSTDTLTLILAGLLASILLTTLSMGLQTLFIVLEAGHESNPPAGAISEESRELLAKQQSQLNSYRYLDRSKGIVAIPIEKAMEKALVETQDGKKAEGPSQGRAGNGP